jgi:hypothetical protein
MKKLTDAEARILRALRNSGRPYWPSKDATDEPFIMDTLKALVRKKYLTADMTDDGPAFTITSYGRDAYDA